MTTVPTDPLIGQTLDGRYSIRSRIARGGMAMVYLAQDLRLERRVAVKVMHEHLAEDDNFTRRFEREARSAAGLSHANLVNVFDQGHDLGRTYLVMEYLPSITLRDLLKQQKRLTTEQTFEISEAVLAGLASAHQAGIVHRDLKPENVLLADDGRIKLGDFGLARAVSANTTTGQALLGTIAYLSPELVTRGVADARSDIYAFGIMLYEMLTGVQPFTGEQPMQIAFQHANSEVPPPSQVSPESTAQLDDLVRWLTQRDPDQRPATAVEALDQLRRVRDGGAQRSGDTRILPDSHAPATTTTVLDEVQTNDRQRPAPLPLAPASPDPHVAHPITPLDAAASGERRRQRRGRLVAVTAALLIIGGGATGYWFGQGPGSLVTVPDVSGQEIADARAALEERTLVPETVECPSLEIDAGLAAETRPAVGTRLDRGSEVELCESTGPRILPVPTIVGADLENAKQEIADAGFVVGDVEMRFGDAPAGQVTAALDADGQGLGDTYPEQSVVSLIASAGQVPDVRGLTISEATRLLDGAGLEIDSDGGDTMFDSDVSKDRVISVILPEGPLRVGDAVPLRASAGPLPDVADLTEKKAKAKLEKAGLVIDDSLSANNYSDDLKKGRIISLIATTDPVRPGDTVGLNVSLGPQLFEVPNVTDMTALQAIDTLRQHGFVPLAPITPLLGRAIPEEDWGDVIVTSTNPGAGEMVRAGTEITIRAAT